MKKLVWLIVAGVVLFVGGPWIYINVIRESAPEELTLTTTTVGVSSTTVDVGPIDPAGVWTVGEGSLAGYRVDEVLFGQNVTAVGRTSSVTGEISIQDSEVVAASFSVDLTTVKSDSDRRDNQFANRIMDVLNFPTADFVLTQPISISAEALVGSEFTTEASGELTLRGMTRPIQMQITARLADGTIEISASTEIVFVEWGIPDPSLPGITTEDSGILEVLLKLEKQ
jgi:polyisoprenoid-binding protein YceI